MFPIRWLQAAMSLHRWAQTTRAVAPQEQEKHIPKGKNLIFPHQHHNFRTFLALNEDT